MDVEKRIQQRTKLMTDKQTKKDVMKLMEKTNERLISIHSINRVTLSEIKREMERLVSKDVVVVLLQK